MDYDQYYENTLDKLGVSRRGYGIKLLKDTSTFNRIFKPLIGTDITEIYKILGGSINSADGFYCFYCGNNGHRENCDQCEEGTNWCEEGCEEGHFTCEQCEEGSVICDECGGGNSVTCADCAGDGEIRGDCGDCGWRRDKGMFRL